MRMLGEPINWTNDVATCLFAWACFLCADIAWRKNALMSIDLVTEDCPHGARTAARLSATTRIIVAFLVYVLIGADFIFPGSAARAASRAFPRSATRGSR